MFNLPNTVLNCLVSYLHFGSYKPYSMVLPLFLLVSFLNRNFNYILFMFNKYRKQILNLLCVMQVTNELLMHAAVVSGF
jgi:hypothetical protein